MIDKAFVQTMARYNRWQNQNIFGAAKELSDDARRQNRGAFFGSIHGTLSHLIWGDTMWMSRFDGWESAEGGIPTSPNWVEDWEDLCARRGAADDRIVEWSQRVEGDTLRGELTFFSGAIGHEVTRPFGQMVVHFFNHQTHHRGQVHAMLTSAGVRPSDTDLLFLPEDK